MDVRFCFPKVLFIFDAIEEELSPQKFKDFVLY